MILKIISGGQTGADIGGLKAAKDFGLQTGGWIPKGFLTEDGNKPELAYYGLRETETSDYRERTFRNARDASITIWFGDASTRGGIATWRSCVKCNTTFVRADKHTDEQLAMSIAFAGNATINIAGNRESKKPGIEALTYQRMTNIFRIMRAKGWL